MQTIVLSGGEPTLHPDFFKILKYLDVKGKDMKKIKKIEKINKKILAPVRKGDVVGSIVYTLDGNEIGRSDIIAKRGVQKVGFSDYLIKVSAKFLIGERCWGQKSL